MPAKVEPPDVRNGVAAFPPAYVSSPNELIDSCLACRDPGRALFNLAKSVKGRHGSLVEAKPTALQFQRAAVAHLTWQNSKILKDWEDPSDFWVLFIACWNKVESPGDNAFERAAGRADKRPIRLLFVSEYGDEAVAARLTKTASIAYHLQNERPGQNIYLPVSRVGQALGLTGQHANNIGSATVRILQDSGLLRVTQPDYSKRKRKCKELQFELDRTDLYQPPDSDT